MSNAELLDFYSDDLLSAFGQTIGTGLSTFLEGEVSHDQIQRFLVSSKRTSADLWRIAKPHVRKIERKDAVMIVNDSIAEKPYTDENDIICWHYDHSKDQTIKGINFITALYHSAGLSLKVGFELIAKTEPYGDPKDGKNELYPKLLKQALGNQISFKSIDHKRWNIEPYHKSLKQNASLEKAPTQTVTTQTNYFFAALCSYIRLKLLISSTRLTICSQIQTIFFSTSVCLSQTQFHAAGSPCCVTSVIQY